MAREIALLTDPTSGRGRRVRTTAVTVEAEPVYVPVRAEGHGRVQA